MLPVRRFQGNTIFVGVYHPPAPRIGPDGRLASFFVFAPAPRVTNAATSDKAGASSAAGARAQSAAENTRGALGVSCAGRGLQAAQSPLSAQSPANVLARTHDYNGATAKHPAGMRACGHPLLFRAPRMQQRLVHCMLHCMMAVGIDASDGYLALHARHGTAGITTPRLML